MRIPSTSVCFGFILRACNISGEMFLLFINGQRGPFFSYLFIWLRTSSRRGHPSHSSLFFQTIIHGRAVCQVCVKFQQSRMYRRSYMLLK